MEPYRRRRQGTLSAYSVSLPIHEEISFFCPYMYRPYVHLQCYRGRGRCSLAGSVDFRMTVLLSCSAWHFAFLYLEAGPSVSHLYKLISTVVHTIMPQGLSVASQMYLLNELSFLPPEMYMISFFS